MTKPVLYDYWRSSASYRVRIALNAAGIAYEAVPVNLLEREHVAPEHVARNPLGTVPVLEIDGIRMTQSVAIIEYLDETRGAAFLPQDPRERQRVRALADVVAMDIHPVCNLGVVAEVMRLSGDGDQVRLDWMEKFIGRGLAAFEAMLDHPSTGSFCHDDRPGLADFCLVPQVYNAERWGVDMEPFPRICKIVKRCCAIPAFARAHPDNHKPG